MNPWPIAPISESDLDFPIVNYDFSGFTANELQSLPRLEGIIDATLAELATSIADQTVLIASMAGDLDDLFTILDEMNADDFETILGDLAGIATAGDGLLSGLDSFFIPSSGGPTPGTGAPITAATGPVLPFTARQGFGAETTFPVSAVVSFYNNSQADSHVSKIVFVQPSGAYFTLSSQIPATMAPGEGSSFSVTLTGAAPPTALAQVQIYDDQPGSPHVFQADMGVGSSGYGGGGGGGPFINAPA